MNTTFKNAFGGTAAAITLIAIPTGIFLPSILNRIEATAVSAAEDAAAAKVASEAGLEATAIISNKIDGLILAMANADAEPVSSTSIAFDGSRLRIQSGSGSVPAQFARLLTEDLLAEIVNSGSLSSFRYSSFDGRDWVFVDQTSFNKFTLSQQQAIEASFLRNNAIFEVK